MYVRVMGDDDPLKITTYHMTWLPSGNKAFTYSIYLLLDVVHFFLTGGACCQYEMLTIMNYVAACFVNGFGRLCSYQFDLKSSNSVISSLNVHSHSHR